MGEQCSKSCVKTKSYRKPSVRTPVVRKPKEPEQPHTQNAPSAKPSVKSSFVEQMAVEMVPDVLRKAYSGDVPSLRSMLDSGFPIDYPLNSSGWTLAHIAAEKGIEELADLVVSAWGDLEVQELGQGWTPLMVAAVNGNDQVAKVFLKGGAKRRVKDNNGMNARELAQKYKNLHVYKVLISPDNF